MSHIKLVKLVPGDVMRGLVFDDAVLPFYYALQRLGHKVEIASNRLDPGALNIVFGANIEPSAPWLNQGPRSVVVNLEQFRLEGGRWAGDTDYLNLLAANEVWDYSASNVVFLHEKMNIEANFFRFGLVPEMCRLASGPGQSVDVLFYGALNERRLKIIEALDHAGATVRWLNNVYGQKRDQAIYQARAVINIHSGRCANLEVIRLGYLWANRRAVISEFNDDTERYPGLEAACAFFPYDRLVEGTLDLLGQDGQLVAQAESGYQSFAALSMVEELKTLVGRGFFTSAALASGEGNDSPPVEDRLDSQQEACGSGYPAFLSGPWLDWASPGEGGETCVAIQVGPRWKLWLKCRLLQLRAWRYRQAIARSQGLKKYWRKSKLERLEEEIAHLKGQV